MKISLLFFKCNKVITYKGLVIKSKFSRKYFSLKKVILRFFTEFLESINGNSNDHCVFNSVYLSRNLRNTKFENVRWKSFYFLKHYQQEGFRTLAVFRI